jgi:hypothetical protein
MVYVQLDKSNREEKKFKAVFYDDNRLYLERHSKENWNDWMSAGSLSRWLLWNKKSISASYNDYLKRFNLQKY